MDNSPPAYTDKRWHPAVLAATCGGIGLLRPAPGTWGAGVGLVTATAVSWVEPLLATEVILWLLLNIIAVPICTVAARQLGGLKDPASIVLDEATAMPLVLLVVPAADRSWMVIFLAFGLFRLFDITKPPPCRQIERLPAGLGIMADDWAAAGLAAATLAVATRLIL